MKSPSQHEVTPTRRKTNTAEILIVLDVDDEATSLQTAVTQRLEKLSPRNKKRTMDVGMGTGIQAEHTSVKIDHINQTMKTITHLWHFHACPI
ncbi:unnamed protein product [Mycena citricolor]|uniref:Uncharacterized protein n=1 Tax=Mycena citricolor TaxID=2018698 RepID=A0AAD2H9D5_9AGAR|nr:unnamed protein product [Mycena citricolor]